LLESVDASPFPHSFGRHKELFVAGDRSVCTENGRALFVMDSGSANGGIFGFVVSSSFDFITNSFSPLS